MSRDSIYQYIRQHLTLDRTLPEDFSLPKEKDTSQLTFADGAIDRITIFHTSHGEIDLDALCSVIELIINNQRESAILKLQGIFPAGGFSTMSSYINEI